MVQKEEDHLKKKVRRIKKERKKDNEKRLS